MSLQTAVPNLSPKMSEITRLLNAMDDGEPKAAEELLPLVYEQLRQLAHRKLALERSGHTLQTMDLVHEAWLALVGNESVQWKGRAHFFGAAAEAMRRILINIARRKRAARRGGPNLQMDIIDDLELPANRDSEEILAVHDALENFELIDKQKAELVKLIYFVGMTIPEAATVLGVSEATANRHWKYARARLYSLVTIGA